jgi:predicted outer membrane protein
MKGLSAAASVIALLTAAPAWAQTATPPQNLSSQDQTFLKKAAAGNLAEVRLGQLAE